MSAQTEGPAAAASPAPLFNFWLPPIGAPDNYRLDPDTGRYEYVWGVEASNYVMSSVYAPWLHKMLKLYKERCEIDVCTTCGSTEVSWRTTTEHDLTCAQEYTESDDGDIYCAACDAVRTFNYEYNEEREPQAGARNLIRRFDAASRLVVGDVVAIGYSVGTEEEKVQLHRVKEPACVRFIAEDGSTSEYMPKGPAYPTDGWVFRSAERTQRTHRICEMTWPELMSDGTTPRYLRTNDVWVKAT